MWFMFAEKGGKPAVCLFLLFCQGFAWPISVENIATKCAYSICILTNTYFCYKWNCFDRFCLFLLQMCSRNIKISVVVFLVLIPLITALPHNQHTLSKRSNFFDLECKGIFNKTMFFRLDRICEDCYQLFRETSIHRLCK